MIWNILAIPALRYLFRVGLAPKAALIRRSLNALRKDDLELAIATYFELARRDFSTKKVQILREILVSELRYRKKVLYERTKALEKKFQNFEQSHDDVPKEQDNIEKEIAACHNAVEILNKYLGRMGVGMREMSIPEKTEIRE